MAEVCEVYWGSHGCDKPKAHKGDCVCDCGFGPPYYGARTVFYGEDAAKRGMNVDPEVTEPCPKCGALLQNDKPDPCFGMLPGVHAACCGHGNLKEAYVWSDGGTVRGAKALKYAKALVDAKERPRCLGSVLGAAVLGLAVGRAVAVKATLGAVGVEVRVVR